VSKYIIGIVSNEPWGTLWYSKHYYANELCRYAEKVIFINPPKTWKIGFFFCQPFNCNRINEKMIIVDYGNRLPVGLWPKVFRRINDWMVTRRIEKKFHHRKQEQLILWQFDPFRFVYVPKSLEWKRIYHVVDPYMPIATDPLISKRADLIVVTSPKYVEYYTRFNSNVIHIPHGVQDNPTKDHHSSNDNVISSDLLLVGTVNEDVDLQLLKVIAKEVDGKLLIIGPLKLESERKKEIFRKLVAKENVDWIGPVNAIDLPNYISRTKCCLVAYEFDLKKAIGSRSPLKILHYLSVFKPVVTSVDPEIPELLDCAVYWEKSKNDFFYRCKEILAGNVILDKTRVKQYLEKVRYPVLIERILEALNSE